MFNFQNQNIDKAGHSHSPRLPFSFNVVLITIPPINVSEESSKQPPALDFGKNRRSLGLSLNLSEIIPPGFNIDAALPLERQGYVIY